MEQKNVEMPVVGWTLRGNIFTIQGKGLSRVTILSSQNLLHASTKHPSHVAEFIGSETEFQDSRDILCAK